MSTTVLRAYYNWLVSIRYSMTRRAVKCARAGDRERRGPAPSDRVGTGTALLAVAATAARRGAVQSLRRFGHLEGRRRHAKKRQERYNSALRAL